MINVVCLLFTVALPNTQCFVLGENFIGGAGFLVVSLLQANATLHMCCISELRIVMASMYPVAHTGDGGAGATSVEVSSSSTWKQLLYQMECIYCVGITVTN